jgi:hypothetical protein
MLQVSIDNFVLANLMEKHFEGLILLGYKPYRLYVGTVSEEHIASIFRAVHDELHLPVCLELVRRHKCWYLYTIFLYHISNTFP